MYVSRKAISMQTKLTLRIEEALIQRAKAEAQRRGKSVSQLVAEYFALLSAGSRQQEAALPPKVRALKGILRDADVDVADYHRHLEEKYG
jgi:hypothetical protein